MFPSFFGSLFPIMFGLVFILVIGVFIVTIVRGIAQYGKNEASPRLTVDATVATKRADVSHGHHDGSMMHSSSTTYYVTFEVESGDRMELSLDGREFGMLAEGDRGKLSFQGTRFQGFIRAGREEQG